MLDEHAGDEQQASHEAREHAAPQYSSPNPNACTCCG